ncbi:hypothetical protein NB311A_00675 [Nitrobacter sp. Nb-311A]|nr:hypothetical protein NB311A_00675 [Nitrobacter sp. Nb-311A]
MEEADNIPDFEVVELAAARLTIIDPSDN